MKAYISGPMTGCPHYKMRFDAAETFLRECGFEVINPAKLTAVLPEKETDRNEYLRVDMVLLEMCDIIFMLDGYENSAGAGMELIRAKRLGMPIFYQKDYENKKEANT